MTPPYSFIDNDNSDRNSRYSPINIFFILVELRYIYYTYSNNSVMILHFLFQTKYQIGTIHFKHISIRFARVHGTRVFNIYTTAID